MNGPHGQTPPHAAWMDSWMALMIQWSVCHMLYGSMTHYSPGQIFGVAKWPSAHKAEWSGGQMLTQSSGQGNRWQNAYMVRGADCQMPLGQMATSPHGLTVWLSHGEMVAT